MSEQKEKQGNRLRDERSPYLQQHAFNPVDWYAWGEEAFAAAQREDKPIFLSIGYSTCHWCHVMEHESFEDESVAAFLNAKFISIKVDREERPDVDAIYMTAVQAMTGSGGWPMTVFLDHKLRPFFGGTYFPPRSAYGRPGFMELLKKIADVWDNERSAVAESADELTSMLRVVKSTDSVENFEAPLHAAFQHFAQTFDAAEGGFGAAPKFPRPSILEFLFRYWRAFGEERARAMAFTTLQKMASGGLHDHLGGGFHRYSVDKYWRVSHFEKMLYDQAQLVNAYIDAYQMTGEPQYADPARKTIEYVLRDLTSEEGGFFSAEDADSEGEEGTFYVWTMGQLKHLLGTEDAVFLAFYYGMTEQGNFEHGKNVLHITRSMEMLAEKFFLSLEEADARLRTIEQRLLAARNLRERPFRDDKILTSWNGLFLGALARAGGALGEARYINAAERAARFLKNNLWGNSGLLHRYHSGEARFAAYLDSYAFLIYGLLQLHEATQHEEWLIWAKELQNEQDAKLWDGESGGYFMSEKSDELIVRSKSDYDGAEPSGNSVSAANLLRLAAIFPDAEYQSKADRTLNYLLGHTARYPYAVPFALCSAITFILPKAQLLFAKLGEDMWEFLKARYQRYFPELLVFSANDLGGVASELAESREWKRGAYLCENFACQMPAETPEALSEQMVIASQRHVLKVNLN